MAFASVHYRFSSIVKRNVAYHFRRVSSIASTPRYERIDHYTLVEEETLRDYKAERYYPVKLGELFNGRYRTIGKLGYGSASTVWLCRDLKLSSEYVALKVYVNRSKVHRELPIHQHIANLQTDHPGRDHVRKMLRSFEVDGPHGKHTCLVHEPLGITFDELRAWIPDGLFGVDLIRQTLRHILNGLQFLHKEARVVHTDLQPNNLLLGIHDTSVFADFDSYENESPSPRKELDERTVDLSEARFADCTNTDLIMPNVYRAPEVTLGMPWDSAVDIWAFGMVLWDLFQPKRLFRSKDGDNQYSEAHHLAQMIAVLGPPPSDFLQRSEKWKQFWDDDGKWKADIAIPDDNLESLEQRLEGKEKEQFLTFMRKMLKWKPEDRSDCEGVFFDEWLLADLIESGEIVRDDG